MSGRWDHKCCSDCWVTRFGVETVDGEVRIRVPVVLQGSWLTLLARCCACGRVTTSGIFVRHDPGGLACKGVHEVPHD